MKVLPFSFMRRAAIALIALTCCPDGQGLVASVAAQNPAVTQAKVASIPVEITGDNYILIKARVNGSGPLTFILDSGGGSGLVLYFKAAQALGLKLQGKGKGGGAGQGTFDTTSMKGVSLNFPRVEMSNQTFVVFPPERTPPAFDRVVDGVIGYTLFSRYVVEVDYQARVVNLYEPVVPSKNLVVVMTGGGFEPGDVRPLLLPAFKSDQPLPENRARVARLAAALEAATKPPPSNSAPPLPETARTVSGKSYLFEANALGLKKLSLTFASQTEAALRLTFMDNHAEVRPVGLDGVPRISPNGRYGLPAAVKGWWEGPQTFVLDYDEIGNVNHYQIRLKFNGKHISVEVTERTHDVEAKFAGNLENE